MGQEQASSKITEPDYIYGNIMQNHPIRIVEQGNHHVIVGLSIMEYSIPWYQCCLFSREYQSILYHETYHVIVCKIPW